jgi:hypothetical protein
MAMQTRTSSSSTASVLIILVIILTFPLWIGILAGAVGIVAGVFGAVLGVIGGVFGAIFGIFGALFGWMFDWDWGPWNFHFGFGGLKFFAIITIILVAVYLSRAHR